MKTQTLTEQLEISKLDNRALEEIKTSQARSLREERAETQKLREQIALYERFLCIVEAQSNSSSRRKN